MSASMPCAASALRVSSGYSVLTRRRPGRSATAAASSASECTGRVGADGEHDPGRVGRGLRVGELAERDHLAPPLLDAVAPGDAEVEEPVGHVDGDLLGPQDPHLADAGVLDAGPVGHVRGAVDGQVGVLEQLHGGAFERALGQDEAEHGGRSSQTGGVAGRVLRQAVPVPPPYDVFNFLNLLGIEIPQAGDDDGPRGPAHRDARPDRRHRLPVGARGHHPGRRPVRLRGEPPLARGGQELHHGRLLGQLHLERQGGRPGRWRRRRRCTPGARRRSGTPR